MMVLILKGVVLVFAFMFGLLALLGLLMRPGGCPKCGVFLACEECRRKYNEGDHERQG